MSLLLVAVMVVGLLAVPGGNVQAAMKKKVQLNKKTVTLEVGKKVTLKLKNAPKKKKITWSSNNKKIATVSKKGVVTAKKAGKANITAKVNGKKYVCKVTVKNKKKQETPAPEKPTKPDTPSNPTTPSDPTTPSNPGQPTTPDDPKGKNPGDVSALEKIIKEQNSKGAKLPTDLNAKCTLCYDDDGDEFFEDAGYQWDENGRLIGIGWRGCSMSGSLDLSELTALTKLDCSWNQLSNLDVSKNTALTHLDCNSNQLSSLDVSGATALTYLDCRINQLSSLDKA